MALRGQSSVIGTVLLVAVTVVVASATGTYAFVIAEGSTNEYNPNVVDITQTKPASQGERSAEIVITFEQIAEEPPADQIDILVDGEPVKDMSGLKQTDNGGTDGFGAGDTITISQTDRTALHKGTEVVVRRAQSGQSMLLGELTLDGRNVNVGTFGFSYYTLANFAGGKVCAYSSGTTVDPSRISIEVYNGANWVSPQGYYGTNFDISNLLSTGQNKINTPGDDLSDDDLRVVYDSVNGKTVVYEEQNINYNSC